MSMNQFVSEDIYVRLLGLPYEQWRLASARLVDSEKYMLLGPVPTDEQWEFQPGETVVCEEVALTLGGYGLLAVRGVSEANSES